MAAFYAFFLLSGFCSLVYQVVWLRAAMASFGVTTAMISIVLSVFMAGLALGSWAGGRAARSAADRPASFFFRAYAVIEGLIGISGLLVAPLLRKGRGVLDGTIGGAAEWGSFADYALAGVFVTIVLLPFCACMGATFPVAMAAIRRATPAASPRSFSYLYVPNVLGAMAGALGSAFVLVETLGFQGTLLAAAAGNAVVAVSALVVSGKFRTAEAHGPARTAPASTTEEPPARALFLALLFATGFVSLAMEVVWTRLFVPYQGTVVYAFAAVLGVYLAATALGTWAYRAWSSRSRDGSGAAVGIAALAAAAGSLLALVASDPRVPIPEGPLPSTLRVVLGIGPFCAALGFLTPMLVDRWARGRPERAGSAYAINAVGCIVGPLAAGFGLLPSISERASLVTLAAPLALLGTAALGMRRPSQAVSSARRLAAIGLAVCVAASTIIVATTHSLESGYRDGVVRRDHTATVVATGEGMNKSLFVNGQGMTVLTPITKMMAHLPLTHLDAPPGKGLVLCFGMGTSFRSMMSWGIQVTAVELVPSVPSLFGYFHPGSESLLASPNARIVIDDARRFLDRSRTEFDAIVVDPPPPVEAAGSSLLYSVEFYRTVKRRLRPGGILQQWLPEAEPAILSAVARAIATEFPHVRAFRSIQNWGTHFLASDRPIPPLSPGQAAARLPAAAEGDLLEWGPAQTARDQFRGVLGREVSLDALEALDSRVPTLTDDRPVNEYYVLRRTLGSAEPRRR